MTVDDRDALVRKAQEAISKLDSSSQAFVLGWLTGADPKEALIAVEHAKRALQVGEAEAGK